MPSNDFLVPGIGGKSLRPKLIPTIEANESPIPRDIMPLKLNPILPAVSYPSGSTGIRERITGAAASEEEVDVRND
eukprot:CAMPEP_0184483580 /NCGR_PEP_ID=MMETSP0113_2-20130426/5257_1 /TAXON_ID=91329 /ORGANISM="Norrisiella sphaerica, Strain BC52" /LENGTH=75 /DNA_ID=CAMNT_0026864095 /DNA_START=577 /DNA_END=803 /DNA_ORIENTATION=+